MNSTGPASPAGHPVFNDFGVELIAVDKGQGTEEHQNQQEALEALIHRRPPRSSTDAG